MNLLYITYKVDERDALVGYVVGWINGLAAHMDRIEVICLGGGRADLAENVRVHSLGKERGASRLRRWLRFLLTAWHLRDSVDVAFCQFSPEYVLAIAPLAKWRGWPITLWYTHRHVSWRLRLATALADRVATASSESFQLQTPKLEVIGHGIDAERFRPNSVPAARPDHPVILAVGRRSPIKNYELLIEATAILVNEFGHTNLRVRIVGGDEGNAPPGYARALQRRIDQAGLADWVALVGPVPFGEVVAEFHGATVHVNLCPTGGMDKAVLEGMAAGVPTLVRNETFRPLLAASSAARLVPTDDAHEIAAALERLLQLSSEERAAAGAELRRIVTSQHSEAAFVRRLAAVIAESSR